MTGASSATAVLVVAHVSEEAAQTGNRSPKKNVTVDWDLDKQFTVSFEAEEEGSLVVWVKILRNIFLSNKMSLYLSWDLWLHYYRWSETLVSLIVGMISLWIYLNSTLISTRLFKAKFALEYLFTWWGLICYFVPGLNTRRTIISELRSMFRKSIEEHRQSLDTNHPRWK